MVVPPIPSPRSGKGRKRPFQVPYNATVVVDRDRWRRWLDLLTDQGTSASHRVRKMIEGDLAAAGKG